MPRRKFWTQQRLDELFQLRTVKRWKWEEIGELFGKPGRSCFYAFGYHGLKQRAEAARKANADRPAIDVPDPLARCVAGMDHVPADRALTSPNAPPHNPRARRLLSPTSPDILARVVAQGLTAGILGDPPPGRSALDEKRRGQ